jgi:vacuolar-type H+-ATPase subunit E/Vma4
MTLERLVAEIESRAARELAESKARTDAEKARLTTERDGKVEGIRKRHRQAAEIEARRERAQRLAGARMQAKKLEYEAQEHALARSMDGVRTLLSEFTRSPEYPDVLARMYAYAADELGKDVRVSGRTADAATLKGIAGKAFDPTPAPILGGIIAETPDGERRLTLTFDELLRWREDRVRDLLA